jgi:acetyl-CoA synthetase
VLGVLVRYGVTVFWAPPTVWRMLIRRIWAAWPIRLGEVASGGEPLNPKSSTTSSVSGR